MQDKEPTIKQIEYDKSDTHSISIDTNKKCHKMRIIISVLLSFIAIALIILGLVSIILRFAIAGVIIGIIAIMVWRKDKKRVIRFVVLLVLYMLIMSFIQVVSLHSTCVWIYPFQSAYIGTLRNVVEPDWFPKKFQNVVSDFHFNYNMSWMDPGYYVVSYKTTPEYIMELEEIYAPMSKQAYEEAIKRDGNKAVYQYDSKMIRHEYKSDTAVLETHSYEEFLEYKDFLFEDTVADKIEYYKVYIIDYKNCHEVYYGREWENDSRCGVLIVDVVEDRNGEKVCTVEFNSQ